MRSFINIITEGVLNESVEFHPAQMSEDGMEVRFPENGVLRKSIPCPECNGTGKDQWAIKNGIDQKCWDCFGAKTITETEYNFPSLGVSNTNAEIVCDIIGVECDSHGWISPEQIPNVLRHLIYAKNKSNANFTRDATDTQDTIVDRSGDIPMIRKTARMIDAGVSPDQVMRYIDKMIDICKWAQANNCGLSWA